MDGIQLRDRVSRSGQSQERLALEIGMNPTLFSRILRGLRPEPEDFARRVTAALDRLEQAEQAADKARQKVLKRPVKEVGGVL